MMRLAPTTTLAALLLLTPLRAQPPEPAESPAAPAAPAAPFDFPPEIADAAYDKYFDIQVLRDGLASRDAAAICDAALQLAEGERVLLRPHKSLTSAALLKLALRVASDARDMATVERLAKAAKARNDAEFQTMVELAGKASRGPSLPTGLTVPLELADSDKATKVRTLLQMIAALKTFGDRDGLQGLADDIKEDADLDEKTRGALAKQIADAMAAIPEKTDLDTDVLYKLAAQARGNSIGSVQSGVRSGWHDVIWGPHIDHKGYAVMVASLAAAPGSQAAWVIDLINKAGRIAGAVSIIQQVVRQRKTIAYGNKVWDCGIATYKHWASNKVPYHKPPFYRWVDVPLPNTHQPYVRYKFK